ncbi:hypothetical protein AMTRI_Chr07g78930 [Amborella trichopoda]
MASLSNKNPNLSLASYGAAGPLTLKNKPKSLALLLPSLSLSLSLISSSGLPSLSLSLVCASLSCAFVPSAAMSHTLSLNIEREARRGEKYTNSLSLLDIYVL